MLEYKSSHDEATFDAYESLFKKYPGLHVNLDKTAKLSMEDVTELEEILEELNEL